MPTANIELREVPHPSAMDRVRKFFEPSPAYTPINTEHDNDEEDDDSSQTLEAASEPPFSWLEYCVFLLLGVAMLWAWNMFLAAAPYFQSRFESNKWIYNHFQAAEISVSTITNVLSMVVLSKMQKNASYPKRIAASLVINAICFSVLAISTLAKSSAGAYFGFLLVAIFTASLSTGLIQNGLFAFASGFGRGEYTQAIMTGQGVAGVLPPLTQILSVLAASKPANDAEAEDESNKSACIYFIVAVVVSLLALLAFLYLLGRNNRAEALRSTKRTTVDGSAEGDMLTSSHHDDTLSGRTPVGLWTLFRKLPFLSAGVFVCFTVTMIGFPVFTAEVLSTSGVDDAIFIPLAFLIWNLGDLLGRLLTIWPTVSLTHWPFSLFCIAMARFVFVPLYFLCNVRGRGAVVPSDLFYLIIVQLLFGLTNGYVGSECMMGAGELVEAEEREAAGGFMGLMLVGGLTAGSLLSFALGDV